MPMAPRGETRIVALTGCTRGLGRAMAEGFVRAGLTLSGCARNPARIRALAARLGPEHLVRRADVTDEQEVARWAEETLERFGPPHLLVNAAGVIHEPVPLWQIPRPEAERLIATNVLGVVRVIRHLLPAMIAARRGVIVNFSSGWGRSTSPNVALYCASKWAVEGFTRSLAQELPHGLAAVAFNPGVIDTDMLRAVFGEDAHAHPSPEQWAKRAVPFLLALGPADNGKSLDLTRTK